MVNLALAAYSPQDNPDRMLFIGTFTGTYGAGGGVGDVLNLTPYQSGSNLTGFTDPKNIYGEVLVTVPDVPPGNFSESLAGGSVQPQLGATLQTCALRCFNPNGTELTQGAAYPAGFLAGQIVLEVLLPARTAS